MIPPFLPIRKPLVDGRIMLRKWYYSRIGHVNVLNLYMISKDAKIYTR